MKIELHIPGLLAVPARHLDALQLPDLPVLNCWNGQARVQEVVPGRHGFISERLGTSRPPLAALAWLGASGKAPRRQTFFATPVHLQAGMRDVVLFAGGGLQIDDNELAEIARDAGSHFGDTPSLIIAGDQLFLQAPEALDVHTVPVHCVQGATVRQHLPTGSDASRLNSWVNELQMFLHSHEINQRRAGQGKPQLNGVWVWGEGDLPAVTPPKDVTVHAVSPYMRGLGMLLEAAVINATSADRIRDEREHIIEFDACARALDADDTLAWQEAVEDVSQQWLQPVLERVRGGEVSEAVLYGGDGLARGLTGRTVGWRRLMRWRRSVRAQLSKEE